MSYERRRRGFRPAPMFLPDDFTPGREEFLSVVKPYSIASLLAGEIPVSGKRTFGQMCPLRDLRGFARCILRPNPPCKSAFTGYENGLKTFGKRA